MRRFLTATAFALITTTAYGQDTTELAKQYVAMPEVQNMMSEMFSPAAMGEQIAASLPPNIALNDDKKLRIGTLMSKAMNDLRPKMEELMIAGSAEVFSADELQALIDFYSSEHGASVMTKMTPFFTNIMAQLQPEIMAMQSELGPAILEILSE
ncbi:MAG: DUF2059 domain-containing protein [Pseudomonadota bacterium]